MVFWRRRAKQPADKEPQLLVQQPGTPPRSWEPGFLEYVLQSRRTQAAQVAESNDEETSPSPIETCRDVWAAVLSNLQPKDLARAGAVCKAWQEVAEMPSVRRASFMSAWGLSAVQGEPRAWSFAQMASMSSFVRKVTTSGITSLQALAVKYGADVSHLMRINNLTSHYAIHSRTHAYVPVQSIDDLAGRTVTFEYCNMACREFIVLLDGSALPAAKRAPSLTPTQEAQRQAKLAQLIARSMHIDEHSAKWYLDEAKGDLKAALKLAELDSQWEAAAGCRQRQMHR